MRSVAFIGKSGTGKSTLSKMLSEHHGYELTSIAEPIREVAIMAYGKFDKSMKYPQQTLGLSEDAILKHLGGWIKHVVEQEWNARRKLAQEEGEKFVDRLARSLGVLRSARLLTSSEAMNMLSHLRLACDMGCLPEERRHLVDRLMIEGQPAHVQARAGQELDSDGRDRRRAAVVREALKDFPEVGPPTA
jgi:protein-arginine kinase